MLSITLTTQAPSLVIGLVEACIDWAYCEKKLALISSSELEFTASRHKLHFWSRFMKRGKRTPQPIVDFIKEVLIQVPDIKAMSLVLRIEEKFNVTIDKTTVTRHINRILASGELDVATREASSDVASLDSQRSVSSGVAEHQKDLLGLLDDVRTVVNEYPSTHVEPFLPPGERAPAVPMDRVEPLLWQGLIEHLASDPLVNALSEWQVAASQLAEAVNQACEAAVPAGGRSFGIPRTDGFGVPRLTIHFPTAVGKAILEELIIGRQADMAWSDPGSLLFRSRVIVADRLEIDFDEAKKRFSEVVEEVGSGGISENMQVKLSVLCRRRNVLDKRLAYFVLRREVPGECVLCR